MVTARATSFHRAAVIRDNVAMLKALNTATDVFARVVNECSVEIDGNRVLRDLDAPALEPPFAELRAALTQALRHRKKAEGKFGEADWYWRDVSALAVILERFAESWTDEPLNISKGSLDYDAEPLFAVLEMYRSSIEGNLSGAIMEAYEGPALRALAGRKSE